MYDVIQITVANYFVINCEETTTTERNNKQFSSMLANRIQRDKCTADDIEGRKSGRPTQHGDRYGQPHSLI